MPRNKIIQLVLLCLFFSGCSVPRPQPTVEVNILTPTLQSSLTSTPFPPTKTFTKTPTPVPSSTVTPLPTPTPTLFSTLNDPERIVKIEELIQTNGGCEFPCLWNITPGVTKWGEVRLLLGPLKLNEGLDIYSKKEMGIIPFSQSYHNPSWLSDNGQIVSSFIFIPENKIVRFIEVGSQSNGYYDFPKEYGDLWKMYSPQGLVTRYGVPSRVIIESNDRLYGDRGKVGYGLWIFYDQKGIMIRYDATVNYAATYHFCPEFDLEGEVSRMDMYLQSPDDQTHLEERDDRWNFDRWDLYFVRNDFQTATGKTLEEFSEIFSQTDQPSCFDTPRSVWSLP
jgi:hypothetical protein